MRYKHYCLLLLSFMAVALLSPSPAQSAMKPGQLLLVVNRAVPEGARLARYYAQKRGVPLQNIMSVDTVTGEDVSRQDYEKQIAGPVRDFLSRHGREGTHFACIVLFYGMPLRVGPPHPGPVDSLHIRELRAQLGPLRQKATAASNPQESKALNDEIARTEGEISRLSLSSQGASVDSEIALVLEEKHALEGWLRNRYFPAFRGKDTPDMPLHVMAVCRLDGPTEATVRRIIDDSLYAEEHGLKGKAYFDARWPYPSANETSHYKLYDKAIHNTARIVKKSGRMPVTLDEREALFGPNEAPDAALYCGWYSLGKYIDAFTWARGAVAYHVASAECTTLKGAGSTVWCKRMLEEGVAATVGPVAEPFLESFPAPEVFFGCLLEGGALVECYTISNPYWSWRMVLIGDPLYRPFRPLLERRE